MASWTAARITSCSASANREVAVAERLSSFGMAWSRNLLAERLPDLGQEGVDLRAERAGYLDARLAFLHCVFSVGLGW